MSLVTKKSSRLKDPGADLLDTLTGFWDRWGRLTLSVAGVVVAAGVILVLVQRSRHDREVQASGKLAEAEIMFWQGYYPRSYESAQQVIRDFGGTDAATEAHRIAGDDAYWRGEPGDFRKAADEYRAYLKARGTGLRADAVRRSLAYALESDASALRAQGRTADAAAGFREAAATYEGLVGKFPDRESSSEFLFASARCWRELGQKAEAVKRLQRVLDEFGETATANRARIELAEVTVGNG